MLRKTLLALPMSLLAQTIGPANLVNDRPYEFTCRMRASGLRGRTPVLYFDCFESVAKPQFRPLAASLGWIKKVSIQCARDRREPRAISEITV